VLYDHPLLRNPGASLLLTDLYQLSMMQAYLEAGMTETAVFEFFVRKLPKTRGFLLCAGLEQAVDFLESAHFKPDELEWLAGQGTFSHDFLGYLESFRFSGDLHALPEGTAFFPNEPILRVTAPLPVAQLVETRLINILQFQTLIASKAARMVLAVPGKTLIDFGLRRAHGAEAGLLAARAAYLAGFDATATVLAGRLFGIPISGTMAHSFVQAHATEESAFENFARSRPDNAVLLIDTYDTEAAARKVVALAPKLAKDGISIRGVRLDSGDMSELAKRVREILNRGGLKGVKIFASGGIDETALQNFLRDGAPIDGFGVGTSLTTSQDAPAFDCAYKMQEYAGLARRKRSEGKATWPGRKQVLRYYDDSGGLDHDVLALEDDVASEEGLIKPVMAAGRRLPDLPTLEDASIHAREELARLPGPLRALQPGVGYTVDVAQSVRDLADEVDRRMSGTSD